MKATESATGSVRAALDKALSAPAGALGVAFTGLLLLMAGMATDAALSVRGAGVTTTALRTEARRRDRLLDQLRSDIYRSSTVMRDHVIEPDDARASLQKVELEHLRARIDGTLRQYERNVPATEKKPVDDLVGRVGSYWQSMEPALEWDAATRRAKGGPFLQDVILPLRAELVELTRQINELNERDLDAAEERIQAVLSHFRRRVAIISASALLLGLILGIITIRRVQHLEQETKAHLTEVEQARHELRELSARLVNAQEEERRNLARELHDEVGQAMSAMLVELGRAEGAPDQVTRTERLTSARDGGSRRRDGEEHGAHAAPLDVG